MNHGGTAGALTCGECLSPRREHVVSCLTIGSYLQGLGHGGPGALGGDGDLCRYRAGFWQAGRAGNGASDGGGFRIDSEILYPTDRLGIVAALVLTLTALFRCSRPLSFG